MQMLVFLFMNILLVGSSFLITYRLLKIQNFIDSLTSWITFYIAQIILSELFLGVLKSLNLQNLILVNIAVFTVVYFSAKNRTVRFNLKEVKNTAQRLLEDKTILLSSCVILGFVLVKLYINLINPPFGWDSLNYHFTFPVEWLKNHNLDNPMVVSCDPSPTYYPINGSLFFLWFIFPLKNVFIADLGQLPFFILAFLSVYSLARKLNLSREYAFFAAAIFTLVPNYFKQLSIAYVDIMVSALFLSALNYLFILYKDFSLQNLTLYSVSLGVMAGIKTTAMPLAFLLFVPFLHLCFMKTGVKRTPLFVFIFLFFLAITGGFSYLRNFIQTGNPLYPLNLKLFNRVIFKGVIDSYVYKAHFLPRDYSLAKILFSEGLGAQTLLFFLPAVFLGLPITIIKKRKGLNFNLIYFMLLPILAILTYRLIIPLANLRYIYFLLGVCSVIAFYILDLLKMPKPIAKAMVVICILASAAELAKHAELIASLIISFLLFLISLAAAKKKKSGLFIIIFSGIFILCPIFLEKDYVSNEYARYEKMTGYSGFWPDATKAWLWLNLNTAGDNIAYVGRPVPFPLYGTGFKNNVYYVSVNSVEPAKLHYFVNSRYVWGYDGESVQESFEQVNNYRANADYAVWLRNLFGRKSDYLFIYSLHQVKDIRFPVEDKWAASHPEVFTPVFSNQTIHIYKIRK